ncbi:MAG: tail fiber protein, partial [Tardiphaga sp.]
MSQPFLGTIQLFAFDYAPKGWALCNGQLLSINNNAALFSLIGTKYGGDGRTTFALPDLRGRTPISVAEANIGQIGGEEMHTL